jgi:hypothetical protein
MPNDANSYGSTIDLLNDVAEFLEGQADVRDGSYGEQVPNRAMSLMAEVELTIERLKRDSRLGPSQQWRLVKSDKLPDGAPTYPGGTIYCFYMAPDGCHWEYDLPDVPHSRLATPSKSATDAFNGDTV